MEKAEEEMFFGATQLKLQFNSLQQIQMKLFV